MKNCLVLILALLGISMSPAFAETLRCGSKIVDTGMSMEEVKKHCGQPSSTKTEEQDVRSGSRVVGTTQIHIWRYNRMSGQDAAVLEFDQGKLMSIKYERK